MCWEYNNWSVSGRPEGFARGDLAEYWAWLDPHIRARDALWEELVEGSKPLRGEHIDVFSPDYREKLEAFVAKYVIPVVIKPAKN